MSRTGKCTKIEADEWFPGLGERHHKLLCKGYRKERGQGSLCGWRRSEDSEASSLLGPHSLPYGEAPGRAERLGPRFPVCSTPSREGLCGGPSSRGVGVASLEPHSCGKGEKESKAAFHRKQHFLFVQLSMCAPSRQCPGSQSQGRAQCWHGQRSAGGDWGVFAP